MNNTLDGSAIQALPSTDILDADTSMGAVTLKVGDLDPMVRYYQSGIGLTLLALQGGRAVLGRPGNPSLVLELAPELKYAAATAAGLFHTAFLFEQESDLASSVYSVAKQYPAGFTGSSDHLVSKAFYFDDPEGNGVELYWDRPREEWTWTDGRVAMDTIFLDPNRFLTETLTDAGAVKVTEGRTGVGHIHLKVGDIATAKRFYVDTVGFEITTEFGNQALFVSAGGYHHHLGMNTWRSQGAGERTPALGLGEVSVQLPTTDGLGALRERLQTRGIQVADDGRELVFDDPWRNLVRVSGPAR
ncbi:VOC family protein [Nakamurella lactea]|uniref:VOC family protein n=1 Tax=Nakamurella lactea TaxID=459515 RepID=UPI0003FA9D37|nr:VOC family protein [Nakamurella lactea]